VAKNDLAIELKQMQGALRTGKIKLEKHRLQLAALEIKISAHQSKIAAAKMTGKRTSFQIRTLPKMPLC
jgi:hypothetical protein